MNAPELIFKIGKKMGKIALRLGQGKLRSNFKLDFGGYSYFDTAAANFPEALGSTFGRFARSSLMGMGGDLETQRKVAIHTGCSHHPPQKLPEVPLNADIRFHCYCNIHVW